MKQLFLIPLVLLALLSVAACGDSGDETTTPETPEHPEMPGSNGSYLVVYFSHTGNTERIANEIKSVLDCNIIEVIPQTPYPNGNAIYDRAHSEQDAIDEGRFPAITTIVDSFEQYDLIIVGYPIWSNRIATPMQAFLYNHATKLSGKRIALFASSGGSSISNSVNEAHRLVPDAAFINENLLLTSFNQSRIESWLEQLKVSSEPNSN